MLNVEPRDSDDSQYEYDEPKKPLTQRQLANYALVATGAIASVAFGWQVAGPAIASAMYPSTTQAETTLSSPSPQASNADYAGDSYSGTPSAGPIDQYSSAANLGVAPAAVLGAAGAAGSVAASGSQIQLPTGAPSFGNLSSATPSGGSMAAWSSGSGKDHEDEGRDDDDDEDEDDDEDDDEDEDDD